MRELGEKKTLYSVLVESCPERWEKALASQPPGSLMAAVFESEMQAASLAAKEFSRPLVLGDQRFGDTTSRIKTVFLQSLRDIVSPWKGWKSLYEDIAGLGKDFIPKGNDNFGLSDILDPKLLSTAPISILRYTSAIVLKAPKFGVPALGLFVYSAVQSVAEEMNPSALMPAVESSTDIALSIAATAAFNVLQVALLGRVILQALLHERNVILAANILEECKRAKLAGKEGDTVVAVLGMAHCNGVKDILTAAGSQ